ncbi:hypothetical protein QTP86_008679 [Hemibagrus guttatus]|nr:hypothetical protein QTP86_008679 [Hemibagrus guttatus]
MFRERDCVLIGYTVNGGGDCVLIGYAINGGRDCVLIGYTVNGGGDCILIGYTVNGGVDCVLIGYTINGAGDCVLIGYTVNGAMDCVLIGYVVNGVGDCVLIGYTVNGAMDCVLIGYVVNGVGDCVVIRYTVNGVERMGFLDTLSNVIADCDTADILILGGDFNCTTDDLDRNHAEPHVASRKRLWEYTLNVTRDIVRYLKALEIEIAELQRLEATGDRGHIEALKSKKAKMNDLLDITAQGALVRSRFKSAAEMDAPSKFFFSLEQKNGQKRFIYAVRTESGDLLSEPTEIRKQTVSFYSKLYSSEWSGAQVVEDSFLVGLPKLSE